MRSYGISVEFKEKLGSVESTLRIEVSGPDLGGHSARDETISLLLAKIKGFGKDDAIPQEKGRCGDLPEAH